MCDDQLLIAQGVPWMLLLLLSSTSILGGKDAVYALSRVLIVQPANVLIDDDDGAVLADFGE